jgi:hypothetical protein
MNRRVTREAHGNNSHSPPNSELNGNLVGHALPGPMDAMTTRTCLYGHHSFRLYGHCDVFSDSPETFLASGCNAYGQMKEVCQISPDLLRSPVGLNSIDTSSSNNVVPANHAPPPSLTGQCVIAPPACIAVSIWSSI